MPSFDGGDMLHHGCFFGKILNPKDPFLLSQNCRKKSVRLYVQYSLALDAQKFSKASCGKIVNKFR